MADKRTGLGQSMDEVETVSLSSISASIGSKASAATSYVVQLQDMGISEGGDLSIDGEKVTTLDELGWAALAKVFKIPGAYMKRLNAHMRRANVMYWAGLQPDKEITLKILPGGELDCVMGMRIELGDVVELADIDYPTAQVYRVNNTTNATVMDIVEPGSETVINGHTYLTGIRLGVPRKMNAPTVSALLVDRDSCGVVEYEAGDGMNIKGLTYEDILGVVDEYLHRAGDAQGTLVKAYGHIAADVVERPRRRLRLLCRENAIPERVEGYILDTFDDNSFDEAVTYGDLVNLLGACGMIEEVKESSARKLSRLAGSMIMNAAREHRCPECDSMLLDGEDA